MFADTHCHLDFDRLASQVSVIKQGMDEKSVSMVVVPSVARLNWSAVMDVCAQDERFYFGLGLHPCFIDDHDEIDVFKLENIVQCLLADKRERIVAIGEIGLDYTKSSRERQVCLFESQLKLAEKYQLPVIVHVRKAHSEVLASLSKFSLVGGVVHGFSGSYELMMRYITIGFKIGVGPVITWLPSTKTRNSIALAPVDALVLETDSPDMYVSGVSRGCGSPVDVCKVFDVLKRIRKESGIYLEKRLWENGESLFLGSRKF